jgi:hypothetical protein
MPVPQEAIHHVSSTGQQQGMPSVLQMWDSAISGASWSMIMQKLKVFASKLIEAAFVKTLVQPGWHESLPESCHCS